MNIRNILHSGEVVRFHNHVGIDKQKNSSHQWGVALIIQHVYPQCSKELLLAAMTHDCAEYYIGDIPSPVKWDNPELKEMLSQIEKKWEESNGVDFDLNFEEKLVLKIGDTLEGMWYCVQQVRLGNINAKRPFRKWRKFLANFFTECNVGDNSTLKEVFKKSSELAFKIVREMEEL